jgi:GTPase SAR1 family protein
MHKNLNWGGKGYSMPKIKIISNPYQKKINYQYFNDDLGEWIALGSEKTANSRLLKDSYSKCFFPFNVSKILDEIVTEFSVDSYPLEITFEGTDDEYDDISSVCKSEKYSHEFHVNRSSRTLENARDVLPKIIELFKSISLLINKSVHDSSRIQEDLNKFSDASNNIIPICVMGTYSTGKSTFINSLIGHEILPSGENPVTAKVYRIENSQQNDRASVAFTYNGIDEEITFDSYGYKLVNSAEGNPIIKSIVEKLSSSDGGDMIANVRSVIETINDQKPNEEDGKIDDYVRVLIPFYGPLSRDAAGKFVIFDTPGSNSASNSRHFEVLKKALRNLSNGLPIYVTSYDTLDTTDNEMLYKQLKSMEALDRRFTMIVVNKADGADLPENGFTENEVKYILDESTPKNLYSEGIYFVSSIMGLGSKTGGKFHDRNYTRTFLKNENFYQNNGFDFYTRLYEYNIMAEQLKNKATKDAEICTDLIYANSGLFSVENEIQTFAKKYSSYNKCHQADLFLGNIIEITKNDVLESKKKSEKEKIIFDEKLENDKKCLIEEIDKKSLELQNTYMEDYPKYMEKLSTDEVKKSYEDDLSDEKSEYTKNESNNNRMSEKENELNAAQNAIFDNVMDELTDAWKDKDIKRINSILPNLQRDYQSAQVKKGILQDAKDNVKSTVADELIDKKKNDFTSNLAKAQEAFEDSSKKYWIEKSEEARKTLRLLVTGTDSLSDEKKTELNGVIMNYSGIMFDEKADIIFRRDLFIKSIRIGKHLLGQADISIEKLKNIYNDAVKDNIDNICDGVKESHQRSFYEWFMHLQNLIKNNIVEYSPELHTTAVLIANTLEDIHEQENRQRQLDEYSAEIKKMMDWIEIE